ncbi:MAG TPA: hypothetical protein VFA89_00405 [Terriglobales bacterium]|nr:hypothetical protein [Terriglobales bacterium]
MTSSSKDQDRLKGALEQDDRNEASNNSLQGQLGHRDQDPMIKGADSDFPEPGQNPEHSGEPNGTKPTHKVKRDEVA